MFEPQKTLGAGTAILSICFIDFDSFTLERERELVSLVPFQEIANIIGTCKQNLKKLSQKKKT